MSVAEDSTLLDWEAIRKRYNGTFLVGNGASRAVTDRFGYDSLLEVAQEGIEHPLEQDDLRVFETLNETDFEKVLEQLSAAAKLATIEGEGGDQIHRRYERIRQSLIEAVQWVHPRHGELLQDRFENVQEALLHFRHVFTTNYDLLIYWAVTSTAQMHEFRDFFWNPGNAYEAASTWTPGGKTHIYYLHGALHLFRLPSGTTVKASGGAEGPFGTYTPLLDLVFDYEGASYPLFVSEGSAKDKESAIKSNDYLIFSFRRWVERVWNSDPLAIFGHRLGESDEHLVGPLREKIAKAQEKGWTWPLAISVRPGSSEDILATKSYYADRLGTTSLEFFDSTSHPLGA